MTQTSPLLLALLFAAGMNAQTPCDWFDHDGDGVIGGNTFLYALGDYGVVGGPMDPDSSGVQDLSDLLSFLPYFGNSCDNLDWYDTTTGHIIYLAVVEYAVHTEDLAGLGSTLPAGSVTYHLYALLEDPDDFLLAVYGDEDRPLVLETADAFYGFGDEPGETVVVSSYQPLFNSAFPANEFTSWFNAGVDADANSTASVGWVAGIANWTDGLDAGSITMDDSIGGAFFNNFPLPTTNNGAVPIGQFTVTDPSAFSGTINLLAKTAMDDGTEGIEFAEGLTFSNADLTVFGCMDEEATNFDPAATWQLDGDCAYPGDFNGDGEFTVEDLLGMLADFGCTSCPQGDINGDGVVNVQDILLFLTLL
ncbi:MAG: hypothetical protein CBD69_010760 [Crocinitomicaceae bacterium TMED209]|nr:MAG: hypothetical protein CBD69_010760 [Crocinitomicaceae bacterium TMED209]|tara:strand:+ start:652 stop:1740 length:1089 start_codon:yes stop_codon:yes gene_type:complete